MTGPRTKKTRLLREEILLHLQLAAGHPVLLHELGQGCRDGWVTTDQMRRALDPLEFELHHGDVYVQLRALANLNEIFYWPAHRHNPILVGDEQFAHGTSNVARWRYRPKPAPTHDARALERWLASR